MKKILIRCVLGVMAIALLATAFVAYKFYPHISLVFKSMFFYTPAFQKLETAKKYCPDYSGASLADCYFDFVSKLDIDPQAAGLATSLLMSMGPSILLKEAKQLKTNLARAQNMNRMLDLILVNLTKIKQAQIRSLSSDPSTNKVDSQFSALWSEIAGEKAVGMHKQIKEKILSLSDISPEDQEHLIKDLDRKLEEIQQLAQSNSQLAV